MRADPRCTLGVLDVLCQGQSGQEGVTVPGAFPEQSQSELGINAAAVIGRAQKEREKQQLVLRAG